MHAAFTHKPSVIAVLSMALIAPMAQAQTSQVFTENAKTWTGGDTIYMYGVPVKNAVDGKASYWDVQIQVGAAADLTGKPNQVTLKSVVKSPAVKKAGFVSGDYKLDTHPCTLDASTFNGRTQYDLTCYWTGDTLKLTWYTGPISGHPDEAALRAAKLDQLTGSDEYAWGKVVYNSYTSWSGCYMGFGYLIGARQVGDALTINNYGSDSALNCQINLTRTPTVQ